MRFLNLIFRNLRRNVLRSLLTSTPNASGLTQMARSHTFNPHITMSTPFVRNLILGLSGFVLASSPANAQEPIAATLRNALCLHATFDHGTDADFARGDRALWTAPTMTKRDAALKGLPISEEVTLEPKAGRSGGGCLRFSKSKGPMVFFKAEKNFPTPTANWSGTVSFWLSTDPAKDLLDGFCDPIQITSKQWDDAALFVEFEKRPSGIPFRLGVYADKKVWNPTGRKFEEIPTAEKPLLGVEKPPFVGGKWTHVAFSVAHFNSGEPNGIATLYLDGKKAGEVSPRTQTFTWEPNQAAVMLGLSYVGLMDDLALFERALTPEEIAQLYTNKL